MGKDVRYLMLFAALLGNFYLGFTQDFSTPPPEPMVEQETHPAGPCGGGDGGVGPGIPPPVGRCLPINDYILPLMVSGIILGALFLFDFQRNREARNSIP